jgi:hypothetical protein
MIWPFMFLGLATAFDNPPGVDTWCGKAYKSTYVISIDSKTELIHYLEMFRSSPEAG